MTGQGPPDPSARSLPGWGPGLPPKRREGVLAAMSGGVDSSAAAIVLLEAGWRVVGATMRLLDDDAAPQTDSAGRSCCSLNDILDARAVSQKLNFDHQVHNFSGVFRREVVDRFVAAYRSGLTPNPCVDCNRRLKFTRLYERAELLGCGWLATGHYAKIEFDVASGRHLLKKARDKTKDQSYFLYGLTQEELARTIFPLGDMLKTEVRALAAARGIVNAGKPDSQDVCFIPDGRLDLFLERMGLAPEPGPLVSTDGKVLGEHRGAHLFTIGQRKGLGLCRPEPTYVTAVDPATNTVVVGDERDLYSDSAVIGDVNLISLEKISGPLEVTAKIRYRQQEFPAVLEPADGGRLRLVFREPQRAAAPGQAAVFYLGDVVAGGGTILRREAVRPY
ncbi:MAG: tRNA 2-thiouridine(34) synthase MnmA [Deltaproteobacteria bacterium]|nr:tRNA 2-thiouridine(34) synthase MnmA [Deltaproteobacteria bacterium]